MMTTTRRTALVATLFALAACSAADDPGQSHEDITELDPEHQAQPGYAEGVEGDDTPYDVSGEGNKSSYEIPTDLPVLENPEIIISLSKPLVVHLFDRETGFSAVYPTGVGKLGSSGVSWTPSGHFTVGTADHTNSWYWVKRRYAPEYFGGLPFLRLNIENSQGHHTYGLHGPITQTLIQDYVSHGCMRMRAPDVVDMFWMLFERRERSGSEASITPVSIVPGQALDAVGAVLDDGDEAVVWQVDEPIDWEAMGLPPRPAELDPAWNGDAQGWN